MYFFGKPCTSMRKAWLGWSILEYFSIKASWASMSSLQRTFLGAKHLYDWRLFSFDPSVHICSKVRNCRSVDNLFLLEPRSASFHRLHMFFYLLFYQLPSYLYSIFLYRYPSIYIFLSIFSIFILLSTHQSMVYLFT